MFESLAGRSSVIAAGESGGRVSQHRLDAFIVDHQRAHAAWNGESPPACCSQTRLARALSGENSAGERDTIMKRLGWQNNACPDSVGLGSWLRATRCLCHAGEARSPLRRGRFAGLRNAGT